MSVVFVFNITTKKAERGYNSVSKREYFIYEMEIIIWEKNEFELSKPKYIYQVNMLYVNKLLLTKAPILINQMLLLASTIGSGIGLLTLAILNYCTHTYSQQHILPPNISNIAFHSTIFFLSLGVFPAAYVLISEIFPEKVRIYQCSLRMFPCQVHNISTFVCSQ